jgi:hypothetical protein
VDWKRGKRQDRKGDLEEGTERGLERAWRQDWKDAKRAWKEGDRKKDLELVGKGSKGTLKKGIIFSKGARRGGLEV